MFLAYYFFVLFFATFGFFIINNDDIRKYCRTGLAEVRKWIKSHDKDRDKEKETFIKDYLPIFPTIINQSNLLALRIFPGMPPHVLESHSYSKALFASVILTKDKQRLNAVKNGLRQMINALKVRSIEFFYPFVEGLKQIEGTEEKEPMFCHIRKAFEVEPDFATWVRKHLALIIQLGIFILGIIATTLIQLSL